MSRSTTLLALAAGVLLSGCDYTGDWLFANPSEAVPGVIDLGTLAPVAATTYEELQAATLYGEVGAPASGQIGGLTFNFEGTGSSVCVWVDPETVYWSQAVAEQGARSWYSYPDNHDDDGDIDLYAGFSVYYGGSPGVSMGDFEVRYQDDLGNEIPVQFNECTITSARYPGGGAHSGRAAPEYCTLNNTQQGVDYTVVLETFSPPRDDNRLGYGLMFVQGPCDDLLALNTTGEDECMIVGESIRPDSGHDYREEFDGPILASGFAEVESYVWQDSTVIEGLFCEAASLARNGLRDYCEEEALRIPDRNSCGEEGVRCYCGDITDTPRGGAR